MNRRLSIKSPRCPNIELRSIDSGDLDSLRQWKNENRKAFYFQDEITRDMQEAWFRSYLARNDDFMFCVQTACGAVGCIAFRLLDGELDIYNVIRGKSRDETRGAMSDAFKLMANFAWTLYPGLTMRLEVMKGNPAVEWYAQNGMFIAGENDQCHIMRLPPSAIPHWPLDGESL